jgi:hypothetical protein
VQGGPEKKYLIHFSFNYHCEVVQYEPSARSKKIIEIVKDWETTLQYVKKLVALGI